MHLPNPGLEIETLSLKSTLVKDLAITTGSLFEILRNLATISYNLKLQNTEIFYTRILIQKDFQVDIFFSYF